ncbi:MAG: hypothetical protein KDA60_21900, partial [Planctomycetales bacterium]|nr:hypothetical protein [Planctomycetales bacterium]
MKRRSFLLAAGGLAAASGFPSARVLRAQSTPPPASGPLRPHPENPRYFTDGSGSAILLTGSHVWNNLVDMGRGVPPESFDFSAYLDFLARYHHNFIRLWTWDSTTWNTRANGKLGKDFVHHVAPLPWARVGQGKALDGQPQFDLEGFDEEYFERLSARVRAAGARGIYVSVMLFEGWGLMHGNKGRSAPDGWAWRSHPFHPANNVNGIDASLADDPLSGRPHRLGNRAINDIQVKYIRHVVDTVNAFDNVLYEVINEGGDPQWDWWVVRTVRDHESTKPKQHPIGITGHGAERLSSMLASPADWISPGRRDGFADNPPAWNENKVSVLDTDHVWGVGGNHAWVWKAFLRGHNPIFMDPYDGEVLGTSFDERWEPIRRSMGWVRQLAERVNLLAMTPHDELASSKYCLADPQREFLVYVPGGSEVTVNLSTATGKLESQWIA